MRGREFLDQLSNEQLLKRDALSVYMQLVACESTKCDDNPNKNLIPCIALSCHITVTENNMQEEHKHIIK